ncbi:hypothetical protein Bind_3364 [Beijerinckia indica subsp. indica ATCC 9039]|uniref:Uncharacterized protein n=1 Tax=Beijerinckia indica subsp. indica (strain ATCC 9039 / DSM 1715 / NCIMB 8712) TaxID=395963 RepID=B2IDY9_BEII9|nr:hypothetical protein Bind_3364 [Beijerinckia indica subsp. indica ATCC 9039]
MRAESALMATKSSATFGLANGSAVGKSFQDARIQEIWFDELAIIIPACSLPACPRPEGRGLGFVLHFSTVIWHFNAKIPDSDPWFLFECSLFQTVSEHSRMAQRSFLMTDATRSPRRPKTHPPQLFSWMRRISHPAGPFDPQTAEATHVRHIIPARSIPIDQARGHTDPAPKHLPHSPPDRCKQFQASFREFRIEDLSSPLLLLADRIRDRQTA